MAYLTDFQYYDNAGVPPTDQNWGSYQYVSLSDIINNFMLMHTGNTSLINNEPRYKIRFHAKRAIQELNYDAFKEIKALEMDTCDTLRFIMPPDYVNWVRVSVYEDGILKPLSENIQTLSAKRYEANNCVLVFDGSGSVVDVASQIDTDRLAGNKKSIYLNQSSAFDGLEGWEVDGVWYFDMSIGGRYGLNTETANANPTFQVDKKAGVINFDSSMSGKLCILEYITDGMEAGDDTKVGVNKLFEKYVYAYIKAEILSDKLGVQEYIVRRAKKDASALLRNAKIRISNIHPARLLMNLRGRQKWLK